MHRLECDFGPEYTKHVVAGLAWYIGPNDVWQQARNGRNRYYLIT